MKYYIKERFDRSERMNTAGTKARSDVEQIASHAGFSKAVIISDQEPLMSDSLMVKWRRHIHIYRQWKSLCDRLVCGDILLFQLPLMNNSIFLEKILKKMKKKGIVTAAVVHDLEALRLYKYKQKKTPEKFLKSYLKTVIEERYIVARCSKVIVHNDRMKNFLIREGIDSRNIIVLEIFDYLTNIKTQSGKKLEKTVCVAGNLSFEKAKYIYDIKDMRVTYRLYGPGFTEEGSEHLCYMGCLPPEELPGKLDAAFGLVWDGTSTKSCRGVYGEYLLYNNPHKTSLYLAAGIPVIIWERAALADFIVKNRAGMTIASLEEISQKIDALSEEDYQDMLQNAEKLGQKIKKGFYLTKALEKI